MAQQPVASTLRPFRNSIYLILLLGALMHWFALPKVSIISKQGATGAVQTKNLLFPVNLNSHNENDGPQMYIISIDYSSLQQGRFRVHAQNCLRRLTLNGFPISFPMDQGCKWGDGFIIDLNTQLQKGKNTLRFETAGPGISISPLIFSRSFSLSDIFGYLLVIASASAIYNLIAHLMRDRMAALLIAVAWVLYIYLMNQTNFMWKKYDMPQHLDYITYIANTLAWPSIYKGFLTYHPPLYYTLQAAVLRLANALGSFDFLGSLRLFNVMYFTGFIIFAALTLRRLVTQPLPYYLSLAMLLFYPGGLVASARMDSDLLFYPCFAGCIYFLLRWLQEGSNRDLGWAIAISGMAFATRTNALVLMPLFGLAGLYRIYKFGWRSLLPLLQSRALWIGVGILAIGCMMNFGRAAYENMLTNRQQSYLVGNASFLELIAAGLRITNEWESYFGFSLKQYFETPFFNVWSSYGGRYYFWISILKTSMYGEFTFPKVQIAYYLTCLMLGFVFYIPASIAMNYRQLKYQPQWLMFFFTLFIPILGLAVNRILHPIACSQDFRYVYPAIMAFCGLVGFAIEQHLVQKRYLMAATGGAGILCFVILSMVFGINMVK